MNFCEAESYLFALGNEVETMKLGLDNIRKLLAALDDPQKNFLKVQVAGTNGKGSVCAFLDPICREAGISAGVFTSPHLISITERVRINGVDITEDEFARQASLIRYTAERLVAAGDLEYTPTFFEQITAIALVAFAEAKVQLAILETGLGGRLDATTAANAEVAAITRIDLDHQEYLGDTIDEIAGEKAAIVTDMTTDVVIGAQTSDAMEVIVEACERRGISPRLATGIDADAAELGLCGRHQVENAQVAVGVARILRHRFAISAENIRKGLHAADHPGRLDEYERYLFDGAHNIGGAKALREFLDESIDEPITLVFGAMKGKDVRGFAELIFPKADQIIVTSVDTPRSMTAEDITDAVGPIATDIQKTENVREALGKANELTPASGIILVTGSLYLVGEVKKLLESEI